MSATTKFKVGDRVKVVGKEWSAFAGVTGVVTEVDTTGRPFIKPDKDRPDGFRRDSFFWTGSDVELAERVLNKPEYVMPELPKTGDYVRVTYVNGTTHEAEVIGLRDSSRICPFYNIHFSDGRWTVVPVDAEAYKQYSKDEPHNIVIKVEHIERPVDIPEVGRWIEATTRDGKTHVVEVDRNDEHRIACQVAPLDNGYMLSIPKTPRAGTNDAAFAVSWKYVAPPKEEVKPVEIDGYWVIRSPETGLVRAYLTEDAAKQDGVSHDQARTVEEAYESISRYSKSANLRKYIPALLAIIKFLEHSDNEED